jgi:hypothetical protein
MDKLIQNSALANPSDIAQAESFLADLPAACSGSNAYVTDDGTVNIRVICTNGGTAVNGLVSVKNGLVTKIR